MLQNLIVLRGAEQPTSDVALARREYRPFGPTEKLSCVGILGRRARTKPKVLLARLGRISIGVLSTSVQPKVALLMLSKAEQALQPL